MDAPAVERQGETVEESALAEELHELIHSGAIRRADFPAKLDTLAKRYHDAVYAELIYLLSHLRFPSDVARNHWRTILDHRESMEQRLGAPVDVRVAMASYFMHVEQLSNPKIIEWKLFEHTRTSAYRDELTGLRNYRSFSEYLGQEIDRSEQYNAPLSLLMIDVDDFKNYNDELGHEAGNVVLREIGGLLASCTRKVDVPARYGGEEFAVILPSTPKAATVGVAERIRVAVEGHAFPTGTVTARLTVSVGVAVCPADATTAEELVRHVDQALYRAKSDGKNRIRFYGDSLRSFPRICESLEGSVSTDGRNRHPLTTVNLSTGGTQFLTRFQLRPDDLVEMRLELPGGRRVIPSTGRVVSTTAQANGTYRVATRTIEMNPADRWALVESLRHED